MFEPKFVSLLLRVAHGISVLRRYHFRADFSFDLLAGLSVAAVALPVAVAYAELAGFEPVVGLYSCILPLIAYAVFGTSRQLMVNPDATACAMVAAAVEPLAGGSPEVYLSLSVTLAFFAGLFCILASLFRLGALADFLSKPVLVGFLNGIGISILLSQSGKLFGFATAAHGIVPRLIEFFSKLKDTHLPSLSIGLGTLAFLILAKRFRPRWPSALVVILFFALIVFAFHLDRTGIAILGQVPEGFPPFRWPTFPSEDLPDLIAESAGLALILFTSGMLTARGFAEKNRHEIDADQELAALGVSNVASALSQGFAVTGADSRTAMADSSGGRTQVTGLVAAATIAVILVFFTKPLQYIPVPSLAAVLIFASLTLFAAQPLYRIWRVDRIAVGLSLLTTLGVVAFGAIQAVLLAVGLSLAQFVKLVARPQDEVLGLVEGMNGFHSIDRHPGAQSIPGVLIYRFSSPLTFFNSDYFKRRVRLAVNTADRSLQMFLLDAIPFGLIDVTGLYALGDLKAELNGQGIAFFIAGRRTELLNWFRSAGLYRPEYEGIFFATFDDAVMAYQR